MHNIFFKILVISLFIFFHSIKAEVATVNGKVIPQDLLDYIKSEVKNQGRTINKEMEENIVDRLIDLEIINQEAKESGLLSDVMVLAQAELSTKELIYTLYLQKYIVDNPIFDDQVRREYDKFKINFDGQEFNASHILVKSKNKAKNLIKKIKRNDDFKQIASKHSIDHDTKANGGDLGWFSKDVMVKSFYDAVKKMSPEEFTQQPVQTQFGWHIIKLNSTRPLNAPSWIDKKDEIKKNMQKERLRKHLDKLRSKAKISIEN